MAAGVCSAGIFVEIHSIDIQAIEISSASISSDFIQLYHKQVLFLDEFMLLKTEIYNGLCHAPVMHLAKSMKLASVVPILLVFLCRGGAIITKLLI